MAITTGDVRSRIGHLIMDSSGIGNELATLCPVANGTLRLTGNSSGRDAPNFCQIDSNGGISNASNTSNSIGGVVLSNGNMTIPMARNIGSMLNMNNFQTRINENINFEAGTQSVLVWTIYQQNLDGKYILTVNSGEGNSGQALFTLISTSPTKRNISNFYGQMSGGNFFFTDNNDTPKIFYVYFNHTTSGTGFSILEYVNISY